MIFPKMRFKVGNVYVSNNDKKLIWYIFFFFFFNVETWVATVNLSSEL